MDDLENRTTDSPAIGGSPGDTVPLQSHVACLDFEDPVLLHALVEAGMQICDINHPDVQLIVVDTPSINAEALKARLPDTLLHRLRSGLVQFIGKNQLQESLNDTQEQVHRLCSRTMLAELLGVSVSTIRSWQRKGLIQPVNKVSKLPYFDFQEVAAAKQLATLIELGIQPELIRKNLRQISRWLPRTRDSLAQLAILTDGKNILLRQGNGLVEPGGQKRIDFDHVEQSQFDVGDADEPDILPFAPLASASADSVQGFLEMAEQLEEAGELLEAIQVYRTLQLAHGPDPDTCLRIGELLFQIGDLNGARERLYQAVELDSELVEARAALGCVLAALEQTELAISAFEGALHLHPDYSDVHFHLARTLQNAGREVKALSHWNRFLALSPNGPWAEEAISQIAFLEQATN